MDRSLLSSSCLLAPLEASWGLLGTFLGALGASWAPLGASRGAFWSLLAPLGAPLGRRPKKGKKKTPKLTHLGCQKGPKIGPKTHQNRRQNRTSKKYLIKTVLGASWGDLGTFSVPSGGHRMHSPCSGARFFEKSLFLKKWPSETDFGPTWAPKGSKMEPKRHPK